MRAPGPRDRVRDWRELPAEAAVVVVVVGGMRTAQCLPGDRPGRKNGPDSWEARPRPRARDRSRRSPQVAGHPVCPYLTDMAFMGCNHASLSSRGTPARLHKPKMTKGCPRFILASGYGG